MGQDRRKHNRFPDIFIVTYRLMAIVPMSAMANGREFAGVGVDIGEAGLGVELAEPIADGAVAQLKFRLINDLRASSEQRECTFLLEAECRYCEPTSKKSYRAGFFFKSAANEDRNFISAYVKDQGLAKVE